MRSINLFCSVLLISFTVLCLSSTAQHLIPISIKTDVVITSDSTIHSSSSLIGSYGLSAFKFYLSNIVLKKKNKIIYTEPSSYHLIDFSDSSTCKLLLDGTLLKKADLIQFCLGIDSVTNVSGAMGGDLDPVKGMYWTWQSGYINSKLEGNFIDKNSKRFTFEYHLGGYSYPTATLQEIELPLKKNSKGIIHFDIKNLLPLFLSSGQTKIMSPGLRAQRFCVLLSKCFWFE